MDLANILQESTSRISEDYFRPSSLDLNRRLRERVYCYELYHQLRLEQTGAFILQGEFGKAGHPYALNVGPVFPDFILHRPGTNNNALVMEVKHTANLRREKITRDLDKLASFANFYRICVFLAFGEEIGGTRASVFAHPFAHDQHFQLWHHRQPLTPAERLYG